MTYLEDLAAEIEAEARPNEAADPSMRMLFLLYAVLALSKGVSTSAPDVHDAWVAWMLGQGRGHRSNVPYADLSPRVQHEDDPFVEAIRRVARRRGLQIR